MTGEDAAEVGPVGTLSLVCRFHLRPGARNWFCGGIIRVSNVYFTSVIYLEVNLFNTRSNNFMLGILSIHIANHSLPKYTLGVTTNE